MQIFNSIKITFFSVDPGKFLEAARDIRTRVYRYKMFKKATGSFGSRFLVPQLVDSWNKLKAQTVESRTAEEFKIGLESEGYWARSEVILQWPRVNP